MSGILLDDPVSLAAMNADGDVNYTPVTVGGGKKKGHCDKSKLFHY